MSQGSAGLSILAMWTKLFLVAPTQRSRFMDLVLHTCGVLQVKNKAAKIVHALQTRGWEGAGGRSSCCRKAGRYIGAVAVTAAVAAQVSG